MTAYSGKFPNRSGSIKRDRCYKKSIFLKRSFVSVHEKVKYLSVIFRRTQVSLNGDFPEVENHYQDEPN